MKIINGIKYRNIFYKHIDDDDDQECFICENTIKKGEHLYKEANIDISSFLPKFPSLYILRVCTTCVKSPEEADEVIIPLLKILNGGIIKISYRYFLKDGSKDIYY